MATTRTVLAQPCIRCGLGGAFPCRGCRQYWYCGKACYLQHFAHGHGGQCKLLQEQGKTSSTQIESTPEQNADCIRRLLRTPSRTLFEPMRVQKLMAFRLKLTSEDAIPSGLINAGNTCFTSAVLQCLVNTHPLQVYLTSSEHSKEKCPITQGHGHLINLKHSFCTICHLKEIVALMLDPRYSAIMPKDLLLNLDKIGDFRLGDQEDAHQFLLDMLFKLHDAFVFIDEINRKLLTTAGPKKGPNAKKSAPEIKPDPEDRQLVESTSLIYQMFGGRFLDKTRCIECGRVTMTPDSFLALSLGLSSGSSVEEALRNYCKIEVLPKSEDSLICETCQHRVTIQRQTTFWQSPEILIVHLKRFDNMGRKINKSVAFSPTLDFTDVISRDSPFAQSGPTSYSLYAMITHYGPFMGAGHYVAFSKLDGKWYLFDDKSVYGINEAIVMKQNAYILFYKKNQSASSSSQTSSSATANNNNNNNNSNNNSSNNNKSSTGPSIRTSQGIVANAASPIQSTSSPSHIPLSTSSDANPISVSPSSQAESSNTQQLAITRLTPPYSVYLNQDGDVMKDLTLRIHLPQLESLDVKKDVQMTLSPSGRFELKSCVYYLLMELVFPVETSSTNCVYYELDRTLVVFMLIAQDPDDSTTPISLSCQVNTEKMSEDDFTFQEESLLPVDAIVGLEDSLTEMEQKFKKGQEKIEALNMETATYKELHENIRELQRNPQRMLLSTTPQATAKAGAAQSTSKTTAPLAGTAKRIKPNEPCPCGSGRKYKICHGKA